MKLLSLKIRKVCSVELENKTAAAVLFFNIFIYRKHLPETANMVY